MKKIFLCLLVVSISFAQEQKLVKSTKPITKTVELAKNSLTIIENENFILDFSLVSKELPKNIECKKGSYSVVVNKETPFGSVIINLSDKNNIPAFKTFSANCVPRGGKFCDTSGFSCLVMFPADEIQMSVEPVIENGLVKKLKLVFLTSNFLNVWEDPKNPNGGCTNPKNPFDKFGRLHNDGVTTLMNIINTNKITEFNEIVKSYMSINNDFQPIGKKIIQNNSIFKFNLNNFSKVAQNYITKLESIVENTDDEKKLYLSFISIEDEIINSNQLNEDEKTTILKMASVGRYSLYYWTMRLNKNTGKLNIGKLKGIIKADLEGAGIGVGVGAAFPPSGPVIGAIGGAIIGSCCASVNAHPKIKISETAVSKEIINVKQ